MIGVLTDRMNKAEAWYAKHDEVCAKRFAAIQEQTKDIPQMAAWAADKMERERKWREWGDKVLKDGAAEAIKWSLKIIILAVIATVGGTGIMAAVKGLF